MHNSISSKDLKLLAEAKITDGLILFEAERFSNAYYLAGYAIELGLKACVADQIVAGSIPDKRLINDTYTHELDKLIGVAGLRLELENQKKSNQNFNQFWAMASQWNPESRYRFIDKSVCQYLVSSGSRLVQILDATSAQPEFAMWVLNSESEAWKLWIVPKNEKLDYRDFYGVVSRSMTLNSQALFGLDISSVELVDRKNPAVKSLSRSFQIPNGNVHLSNSSFNGFYLPEGIILRSDIKAEKAA
jgi:hypothetical protein